MPSSKEKIQTLRAAVGPWLEAATSEASGMAAVGVAFLRPQVEGFVDEYLNRPTEELDAGIDRALAFLARLRSDHRAPIVVDATGTAWYVRTVTVRNDAGTLLELELGDCVSPPRVSDGPDAIGQEHGGPVDLPERGSAPAGD